MCPNWICTVVSPYRGGEGKNKKHGGEKKKKKPPDNGGRVEESAVGRGNMEVHGTCEQPQHP